MERYKNFFHNNTEIGVSLISICNTPDGRCLDVQKMKENWVKFEDDFASIEEDQLKICCSKLLDDEH